jgi:alkyldihydroxyacetonephosphate synthase
MLYTELNTEIDYSRTNLRLDGWGAKDQDFFLKDHIVEILNLLKEEWGVSEFPKTPGIDLSTLKLPKLRLGVSELKSLSNIVGDENLSTDSQERIFHAVGRSYFDVIRLRNGLIKEFPDCIVYPTDEIQISKLLKYCSDKNISVVPFGGGSSVVGGVEAIKTKSQMAILCVDMTKMDSLIAIDNYSKTATFQAGIYGPKIEKVLNVNGFTLGHFPQSFEYSTIGGWVAAKSSGQQSGKYGKFEKIIVCVNMISPSGEIKTWKLPASSMGPDLNQIIAGSEGTLGIITEVTVRIQKLPSDRKYFGIVFPDFNSGVKFIKEANQSGLKLSMLRLSDEDETRLFANFAGLGKKKTFFRTLKHSLIERLLKWNGIKDNRCVLMCGIDGETSDIEDTLKKTKTLSETFGGFYAGEAPGKNWLKSRYNMPFIRNHFMENGVGVDTLETSITYDRIFHLHDAVTNAIRKSMPKCSSMCHVSHSYPDGASLYFTITFPLDPKNHVAQWQKMKRAATDAIFESGGSISHHHGIGADHKEWYKKTLSKTALNGLLSLKKTWDTKGILNPGKLFLD